MKFLVDNQLPQALAHHLTLLGHDATHVLDVHMDRAADLEIWEYARAAGAAVVSKDADFLHLSITDESGPAFVWIRLGNCRTPALLQSVESALAAIVEALDRGERVVEIR